jgi:predicted NBD/HSP70 family sugar kinase
MALGIGVLITERITAAIVSGEEVVGPVLNRPDTVDTPDALKGIPAEKLVQWVAELAAELKPAEAPAVLGVGLPGIVRNGIVEDSPNFVSFKGVNVQNLLTNAFANTWPAMRVAIFNDADVMAAGIAARHGHLDRLIRVWTLGTGIGYGRYPFAEGVWEAGHSVVTLDPKEQFCGCGGKGHLEGVMGQRAMRLRFMDMEPEEIFEQAAEGDTRCLDFVKLWHRALAAGTASSIHFDGPGKFFITGYNARFVNTVLLLEYLHDMVKLSPLQGYSIEVVPGGESVAVIGAAVNAGQAAERNV